MDEEVKQDIIKREFGPLSTSRGGIKNGISFDEQLLHLKIREALKDKLPSQIRQELVSGDFDGTTYSTNKAKIVVKEVLKAYSIETSEEMEETKKLVLGRYWDLYDKAVSSKQWNVAKGILDSVCNFLGLSAPRKVQIEGINYRINFLEE